MSTYSDKHTQKAACHEPTCEKEATQLVTKNGKLDWYCEEHRQ